TERIFEELWDYDEEPSELSLRAYVKNLRKILGKEKIINQRGRGYCYG
ncbi:helix-turn-helix domain-containing protein, partial [Campylobacter jejuni]